MPTSNDGESAEKLAEKLLSDVEITSLAPSDVDRAAEVASLKPAARQEYYTQCLITQLREEILSLRNGGERLETELARLRPIEVRYLGLESAGRRLRIITGLCGLAMAVGGCLIGQFTAAGNGWWFLSAPQLVGCGWALIVFPGSLQLLVSIFDG